MSAQTCSNLDSAQLCFSGLCAISLYTMHVHFERPEFSISSITRFGIDDLEHKSRFEGIFAGLEDAESLQVMVAWLGATETARKWVLMACTNSHALSPCPKGLRGERAKDCATIVRELCAGLCKIAYFLSKSAQSCTILSKINYLRIVQIMLME